MPNPFTTHKFILELARTNQKEYIEALYACKDSDAPFRDLHNEISQRLKSHDGLVEHLGFADVSTNIWGGENRCAKWKKLDGSPLQEDLDAPETQQEAI